MKHLIRLTDWDRTDVARVFAMADELGRGMHRDCLKGKSVVMFFPQSSIRTRVTFEKGIRLLGAQPILFPSDALDKKEDIRDVCGYLGNWADAVIVRHRDIGLVSRMAESSPVPVINAMTDVNHPCEVLSDMYALSKRRSAFTADEYLFVGHGGNIGRAWKEVADVMGFRLEQCCPDGYGMDGVRTHTDLMQAVRGKDIVCTDSIPAAYLPAFRDCRVTADVMRAANPGALLNPCPPFFRGEEVSADAIDSEFFVGYAFKKCLLEIQQAVILHCLTA